MFYHTLQKIYDKLGPFDGEYKILTVKLDEYLLRLVSLSSNEIIPGELCDELNLNAKQEKIMLHILILSADEGLLKIRYEAHCPIVRAQIQYVNDSDNKIEIDNCPFCGQSHGINKDDFRVTFELLPQPKNLINSIFNKMCNKFTKF